MMAMIMSECPNRKACDRCHNQKLSCKRFGDEPCERCVRLRTECKSSPSLRYRKQQQQQQQQPHGGAPATMTTDSDALLALEYVGGDAGGGGPAGGGGGEEVLSLAETQGPPQPPPAAGGAPGGGLGESRRGGGARSPKRKRTESDDQLVQPDFALINIESIGGGGGSGDGDGGFGSHTAHGPWVVTREPDFDAMASLGGGFGYDHHAAAALFAPHPAGVHLSQAHHPLAVVEPFFSADSGITAAADNWSHQPALRLLDGHSPLSLHTPGPRDIGTPPTTAHYHHHIKPSPLQRELVVASSRKPTKPDRTRKITKATFKSRSRQILLKSSPPKPAAASPSQGSASTHWMPRLSDINSRLFELSSLLTSQLERGDGHGGQNHGHGHHGHHAKGSNGKSKGSAAAPFPVDEMFKLSRQFAEAVQDVTPAASSRGHNHASSSEKSSSKSHRGGGGGKSLDSMADPGSSMFILSTYVRLLDMYQKVFSCIHSKLPQLESPDAFRHWKLPEVTVGSFAVESTPSLQMSLTIQLAEEFLSQLRGAAAGLDPASRLGQDVGASDGSMFSGVVDVSFQAIRSREDSLGTQLAGLRQDLEFMLDD